MTKEQQQLVTDLMAKYPEVYRLLRKTYPRSYRTAIEVGATIDEINAECYLGLCIAATKYRDDKGATFATYAPYWMRACVLTNICHFALSPKRSINQTVSGDIADESGNTLWDQKETSDTGDALDRMIRLEVIADIDVVLRRADRRQADIYRHRYGIGSDSPHNYVETGRAFGISRTRVQEIIKAVEKRIEPALKMLYLKHVLN